MGGAAAGGNLTVSEGATVGRDLWAAGGRLVLGGAVARDVSAAGGQVRLNGSVGGNADLQSDAAEVGPAARLAGNLTVTGSSNFEV